MAEPLIRHQLFRDLGEHEDGELEFVASLPGPAGSVPLDLEHVRLELDVAVEGRVNRLVIRRPHLARRTADPTRELLITLIGEPVLDALLAGHRGTAVSAGDDPDEGTPEIGTDGSESTTRSTRIRSASIDPFLAGLAFTLDRADGPGLLPEERAALWLEAAGLASRHDLGRFLPDLEPMTATALAMLVNASAVQLGNLAGAVGALGPTVDGLARRSTGARHALLRDIARRLAAIEPTDPREDAQLARVEASLVLPDSLPSLITGEAVEARPGSGDECVIVLDHWGRRARGWWVRAFSRGAHVPIGVAPVIAHGEEVRGCLLVPPRYQGVVVFDVVAAAGELRLSESAAHFRAGLAAGGRAVRWERLGQDGAARQEWQRSRHHHELAGDSTRARQADAMSDQKFATSSRFGRSRAARSAKRPGRLVVDLIGDR
jgi:hypothetical protein